MATDNITANGLDNHILNGKYAMQNGTTLVPSIYLSADTTTGFYRSAAHEISILMIQYKSMYSLQPVYKLQVILLLIVLLVMLLHSLR